ncbi:PAS domain S-box protein [uncultured Desulfobacter sp.]|uniref:PAS domain S-box protein n=1 Tax=uncultured Desulfobacter sp. TaxID=240139 RepID=UPI0029C7C1CC|nr:PAS domain S-box protein [uncultured Desulfobacter sp.]
MTRKPTYEELLQKVKKLEEERCAWKKDSFVEASNSKPRGTDSADPDNDFWEKKDNLGSIINVGKLQSIMDDFHKLTGMVTAILDMEGNVIESTGWQDICTKFHRVHPITKKNCTESDLYLVKNIKYGEYIEYQCKNGLWDVVTPLYIGNKHVGNIYTGQFFYEGDPVDENRFIKQAETYGFDKELYLDAFRRIPRYNRKTIKDLMSFLVKFTSYVSNVSYSNLKLETEIYDRKQAEDELRKSERRFQRAMNASQDGIYDWDLETKDIYYSPGWKRMLGYEPDELPNDFSVWEKLTHPDDAKSSWTMMNEVIEGKRDRFEIEFRMKHKNGHWVDILSRSNLYTDDLNGKIRVVGTHVDISEIKKIERELKAREEEHWAILETAMDGFWIIDTAGRFLEVNETYCEMSGYAEEELLHMDISAVEDVEKPFDVATHMQKVLAEGQDRFESRHRRKDGTVFDVEISVQKRPLDEPQCVVFIRDITERKCSELALLESETRFKALHNASFGGIVIHDQGVILECNQGLSEMMGYEYSELIGMDGLLLIADQSREKVKNNIRTGYEKPYEAFGLRKNGEEFPMHLEARNVPYKGKKVRTVEFRDLTEQKKTETEKEKLQAQLLQAQKMESVGRLAGGVAHDFNNMLNIILGNTEIAIEDIAPDDPVHGNLGEILSAAKRSADITRQLLAFSRKQTIAPKILNLNDTIKSMLRMLRRLIGEDIDLAWLPGANIRQVRMDPSQIDQILANLCVNARDAIADVGKITIETGNTTFDSAYCATHPGFVAGDFVLLAVSDDGCGMDQETISKMFEPFFSTKDIGKGTGLGLATVYGIVKQNEGFINVYSEPDQGTTFRIYLPQYRAETESPKKKIAEKISVDGNETILLVEDEPSILRMTRMMLERNGYKILAASTPGEAISIAREHTGKIHLLMTDVVMPEMNGRDLAKNILSLYPNLKRLFMSGYTANVIAHHGVLDEGVNFIQKPFSKQDLAIKIREVLDGAKS